MEDIVIIGAGGFGREVAWLIEEINDFEKTWNLKGFLDAKKLIGEVVNDYPVLGDISWLSEHKHVKTVVAIGDPVSRKKIVQKLAASQITFATIIHPDTKIHASVQIGTGSIICKGTILTVNINIGQHVILNLDSTVGHDVNLEDYITVFPSCNISGFVKVGQISLIGTGTQIIQEITIGDNVYIGAGAVVNRDIPDNSLAVGVPAKVIKSRNVL